MKIELDKVYNMDCIEGMRAIPDRSVDLVLTDPPYGIGVSTVKDGVQKRNKWDVIENYSDWFMAWLKEARRVLKPNGVLYFFHNDMEVIAELMERIRKETDLAFISFCIWDKGDTYRAQSWANRDPDSNTALRSWFNVCEYCLHYFNAPHDADASWKHTGLDRINSNPECYKPIKEWYASELERLGLTYDDIARKYTEATGRKPHMLRHYFQDSQFMIPTKAVYESVYEPLGFMKVWGELQEYEALRQEYEALRQEYEALRQEYEALRQEYEALRQEYEALRNYHRCDTKHCNTWHRAPLPSTNRLHTCEKPLDILERLIRVSCPPGGTVLDPFMGSHSTAVAAHNTRRHYIGFELDPDYYRLGQERLEAVKMQISIFELIGEET